MSQLCGQRSLSPLSGVSAPAAGKITVAAMKGQGDDVRGFWVARHPTKEMDVGRETQGSEKTHSTDCGLEREMEKETVAGFCHLMLS